MRHKRFWSSVFALFLAVFLLSYFGSTPLKEDYEAASVFLREGEEKYRQNYSLLSSASQTRVDVKRHFFSPLQKGKRTELFAFETKKSVVSLYYEKETEKLKAVEACEDMQGFFKGGKGFLPMRLPKEGELFQVIDAEKATILLSEHVINLKNLNAKAELFSLKDPSYTVPFKWNASSLKGTYKEGKWNWRGDEIRVYSSSR